MKLVDFMKLVDWRTLNEQEITVIVPLDKKEDDIFDSEIKENSVIFDSSEDSIQDYDLYDKHGIEVSEVNLKAENQVLYIEDNFGKVYVIFT